MLVSRRRPLRYILFCTLVLLITWYLLSSGQQRSKYAPQVGTKNRPQDARLAPEATGVSDASPISPSVPSAELDHADTGSTQPPATDTLFQTSTESKSSQPSDQLIAAEHPLQGLDKGQQEALVEKVGKGDKEGKATKNPDRSGAGFGQNATFVTIGDQRFYTQHPVKLVQELHGLPLKLPEMQHKFGNEGANEKAVRLKRQAVIKKTFEHAWKGYKTHAWMQDEVMPLTGGHRTTFGGWAATLVDSMDTLWMMGMKDEFEEAVNAASKIDFTTSNSTTLSVFETTIRYLGGFLGAYDISDGKYPVLLEKAKELGSLLYCAFDTPNHMPVTAWPWKEALGGAEQQATSNAILADIGSLTLEFTRLSQITGDMKYYDAVTRISSEFQKVQSQTRIPGLWPITIDARQLTFTDITFSLGALADSMYEYLPKQHILLGGKSELVRYDSMYKYAITAIMNHIVFQPMLPNGEDVLFAGQASASNSMGEDTSSTLNGNAQHLGCFAGGMVGMGAKLFNQPEQMNMARKLVDGCIWGYHTMPTGIMPEIMDLIPCEMNSDCKWNQTLWEEKLRAKVDKRHSSPASREEGEEDPDPPPSIDQLMAENRLQPGIPSIHDRRYILRPEAIESVFVHYRLTGDKDLPDKAWTMFQAIDNATRTDIAHAAIADVTQTGAAIQKVDSMESFWLAETLKYFYLIFSEPDVVDLDTFVLNTEAHPFRRPVPGEPFVKKAKGKE